AAGGAALLQESQSSTRLLGPPEGQLRPPLKLCRHIRSGPGEDLVPYPLRRVMGDGQPTHTFRTYRYQFIALPQCLSERVVVVAAAVLAVAAQKTGGDQQLFLHRGSSFPSSTARTSLSPWYSI